MIDHTLIWTEFVPDCYVATTGDVDFYVQQKSGTHVTAKCQLAGAVRPLFEVDVSCSVEDAMQACVDGFNAWLARSRVEKFSVRRPS